MNKVAEWELLLALWNYDRVSGCAFFCCNANFLSVPVTEAVLLGAKNAAIAGTVVAVPTVRNCLTI